jgi:hypothetical protein
MTKKKYYHNAKFLISEVLTFKSNFFLILALERNYKLLINLLNDDVLVINLLEIIVTLEML